MSPEALQIARRKLDIAIRDLKREYSIAVGKSVAEHAARGVSASSMQIGAIRELGRSTLIARANAAQEIFARMMDVDGADATDEAREQGRALIQEAVGPMSTDLEPPLHKAENLMRTRTPSSFGQERIEAASRAEADLDVDLLRRRRKVTPLSESLRAPRYEAPSSHLAKADELAAGSPPDYPNAIREAVFALESLARLVTPGGATTLGDASKKLRSAKLLDTGWDKILDGIWAFASDSPGVRHGAPSTPNAGATEWMSVRSLVTTAMSMLMLIDQRAPG